jgi:catechol 2,3-dioxygenase-like lactoylglutathione lyase family enzyme
LIKVVGIDHIVIRARNAAAMIEFYSGVLGCAIERDVSAEMGLTQLRAGLALIDIVAVDSVLGRKGGAAPEETGNNMDHFCLQIDKIDESMLTDYLKANNVSFSDFERRYGAEGYGRSIYIRDPEGNVVELRSIAPSESE